MPFTTCVDGTTATQLRIIGSNFERFDIIGCPTPYAMTSGVRGRSTVRSKALYRISSKRVGVDLPGEVVTNIRAEVRNIAVPVVIHGDTELALEQAIDGLGGLLSAAEGACRLVWTRVDGTRREISAYYAAGADQLEIIDQARHRHVEGNLVFRAHYPYWRNWGPSDTSGLGGTFVDNVTSFHALTNDGDVTTWPEILVTGPCERIELGSQTTGQLIRIAEVLAAGQEVRVETDPTKRGVYLNKLWQPSALDPIATDMWPLVPGVNDIVLRAFSPGNAGQWRFVWPALWEGP